MNKFKEKKFWKQLDKRAKTNQISRNEQMLKDIADFRKVLTILVKTIKADEEE